MCSHTFGVSVSVSVCVCACVRERERDRLFAKQASNLVPLCAMPFLTPRAVPVFVTILLLMAVASSGVMSAMLPCANSLSDNPLSCDGIIVYKVEDRRYSIGMWAAAFMAGVIGSSGNLVLVPYLARFRGIFTSAYFAGTGVSGIVASALAAAQVWKTQLRAPNFGVDVFCAVVAASCSVSLVAWLAVVKLDYDYDVVVRKEQRAERRRDNGVELERNSLFGGGGAPRSPVRPPVRINGGGGGGGGAGGGGGGAGALGSDRRGEAGNGSVADAGDGGDGGEGGGVVTSGNGGGTSRGGGRWTGGGHGGAAAADPLRESLLSQQQQHHAHRIDVEASPTAAASAADGAAISFGKMVSRIWPVVLINCLSGMANYGMSVPAAAVAAEHRADIFPSLPTLASITYYVASPFGFGLAGLLPNWAYSPAVATWVVAMAFIAWAALAAAIPTALGRQVQTTGLLVAIAVFGLANPYAISEGFRWCQNLNLGERPARFTAVGMQLGSALGALISFFLF